MRVRRPHPKAGSAYTYGYAVLGESIGWFIGWDLLLEYTAIVAVVAIGVSQYVSFLMTGFGVDPPAWMLGAPRTVGSHRVDLFAMLLCLAVAWLLNRGVLTESDVAITTRVSDNLTGSGRTGSGA